MGFRNMGRRYCSRGRPGTSLGGWKDLTSPVQCAKPPSVWRVEVKESRERAGRAIKITASRKLSQCYHILGD